MANQRRCFFSGIFIIFHYLENKIVNIIGRNDKDKVSKHSFPY